MSISTEPSTSTTVVSRFLPGLAMIVLAVAAAVTLQHLVPTISALLSGLILGIVLANTKLVPTKLWDRTTPAVSFSAKKLLRAGIVLLGLQIVLGDMLDLGVGVLVMVVVIVSLGIASTLVIGTMLGVPVNQRILIACGFSICGAAAIAGTSQVIDAEEEDVAAGIALVALFGTAMIAIIPVTGSLIGLNDEQIGMWAGGSIHEVAQVVAVGGTLSGAALSVAVLVKLARVLMLAPVAAALGTWRRSQHNTEAKRPPIIPLFVIGFIAMALIRTTGEVPAGVVSVASTVQLWLLSAAMFAIGCGCRFATMRKLGWRPVALATVSTAIVAAISLTGVAILA